MREIQERAVIHRTSIIKQAILLIISIIFYLTEWGRLAYLEPTKEIEYE
jgi:hypothetical protein